MKTNFLYRLLSSVRYSSEIRETEQTLVRIPGVSLVARQGLHVVIDVKVLLLHHFLRTYFNNNGDWNITDFKRTHSSHDTDVGQATVRIEFDIVPVIEARERPYFYSEGEYGTVLLKLVEVFLTEVYPNTENAAYRFYSSREDSKRTLSVTKEDGLLQLTSKTDFGFRLPAEFISLRMVDQHHEVYLTGASRVAGSLVLEVLGNILDYLTHADEWKEQAANAASQQSQLNNWFEG